MSPNQSSFTLFLRESAQPPIQKQQASLRARLEHVLGPETVTVEYHPPKVPVDVDSHVLESYKQVREWATDVGVSLSPFFERRDTYDPDIEDVRETLSLPVLWLVETDGNTVLNAYPHVEEAVVTVSAAVAELEPVEKNPESTPDTASPQTDQSSVGRNR